MTGIKYTRCLDNTGWLRVRIASPDSDGYLCEYTKVQCTSEAAGRQLFKILDGWISVGKEASLSSAHARQLLSDVAPGGAAKVEVKYDGQPERETSPFKGSLLQQWANESFNGVNARVTLNSVWDEHYTPIPTGTHSIMAPDSSHANISTIPYANSVPGMLGHDVWFPIGLNGTPVNSSRYIHVGHLSEGCITQHDLTKWTDIYKYLISHRVAGSMGKLIGSLVVTK